MKIKRLQFSIDIKAAKTQIWKALWDEHSYRDWSSLFSEGSYAVADNWDKGSKILFLGPDQGGIYSIIERHIPNKIIEFRHIGIVLKGKEQPIDEETKKWSGTTEVYSISEGRGSNALTIDIDVLEEHVDFMADKLPKALERVKFLSENH